MPGTRLLQQTASQTAGPYVHIGLMPQIAGLQGIVGLDHQIAGPGAAGERIHVAGTLTDGDGALVKDALIEVWQADAAGRWADAGTDFRGWGRAATDFETGLWRLDTIKPGSVEARAPVLHLWIVARGINTGLHTVMYFPDEPLTADDPVLAAVSPANRKDTLIAACTAPGQYRFDIRLQGRGETVFFDV